MLALGLLAACSSAVQAAQVTMFRDPGCGCCLEWARHLEEAMSAEVSVVETADIGKVKAAHAIPQELGSCHTAIVEGYVIEGHVPAEAIQKLLKEKPAGVRGLAVAGMPLGSPGMEAGDRRQTYEVIAMRDSGNYVFARY
jgi:hypothetical protein